MKTHSFQANLCLAILQLKLLTRTHKGGNPSGNAHRGTNYVRQRIQIRTCVVCRPDLYSHTFTGYSFTFQSYISKGIRRQGAGSFVRKSYVSTLCPVVIRPHLCTFRIARLPPGREAVPPELPEHVAGGEPAAGAPPSWGALRRGRSVWFSPRPDFGALTASLVSSSPKERFLFHGHR